ncbi:MAG: hypothetical protein Q8M12_03880 [bacterium]|nr:hypothetical protein [bacterium]
MAWNRPRVKIVYPATVGLRVLTASVLVASYLAVASLAFWAGTRVSEKSEARSLITSVGAVTDAWDEPSDAVMTANAPISASEQLPSNWVDMNVDGLLITQATVSPASPADSKFLYDLTIENKGRRFIGNMEIQVAGKTPAGALAHVPTVSAVDDIQAQTGLMNVGRFLRTRGAFSIPSNIAPKMVFVKLLEHGEIRASKVLWIQSRDRL